MAALAVAFSWQPTTYAEQLIRVQAERELAHIDAGILKEPVLVQATLLDYAGDKELLLKAWISLSKHQASARTILLDYGSEPEFREVLRRYGDAVIPVIQYFRDNDVWTIRVLDSLTGAVKDFWYRLTGHGEAVSRRIDLGPVERGWYAVHFIKDEGHDFLGQFSLHPDGKARWNQTDRVVKASAAFFTSGVRNLETKIDLGQDLTAVDAFWAGVDVALVAVPAKMLLSARSGQKLKFATRTRLIAPRLLPKGQLFRKLGVYGATAATVYVVATNPSLLNSVLAEVADLVGIDPWIMQAAGWTLVIAVLAYVLSWVLVPLANLFLFLLRAFGLARR